MRILYLSLSYLPSRRASSVQVMRMCEAFAQCGHSVTLVAKRDDEPIAAGHDLYSFYGVERCFEITRIARPKWRGGGLVYAAGLASVVLRFRNRVDLVYCRDLVGGAVASELGSPVVFEVHNTYDTKVQRTLWRRMLAGRDFRGLVAISKALVRELAADGLLARMVPIVVAHSPANRIPGRDARETRPGRPRIGYIGNLYPGRGIELVLDLARRMPSYTFEIVGGSEQDLAKWRGPTVPQNVVFRGFVAPAQLADVYGEFDVLLMPYARDGIRGATRLDTARYCSPMKMFEYMASGVPMVASDLPVLGEVLVHEKNALIAPSGDVAAWQSAIQRLLSDTPLRMALARKALEDLETFTPRARTERIFQGLSLA